MTKEKEKKKPFAVQQKNSATICIHTPLHQTLLTARLLAFSLLKTCEGPNVHLSCLYVGSTQHTVTYKIPRKTTKRANTRSSFSEMGTPQNRASFGGFRWR